MAAAEAIQKRGARWKTVTVEGRRFCRKHVRVARMLRNDAGQHRGNPAAAEWGERVVSPRLQILGAQHYGRRLGMDQPIALNLIEAQTDTTGQRLRKIQLRLVLTLQAFLNVSDSKRRYDPRLFQVHAGNDPEP